MKMLRFVLALVVVLLFAKFTSPVYAFEMRTGDSVLVEHTSTISGSLFVSGSSVDVEGTVNGDVYCAGRNITISGQVDGDVLCVGQTIDITGMVNGNVRIAGQTVNVSGLVKRNATVTGQSVNVTHEGKVAGEFFTAAQLLNVAGTVGKSIGGWAQSMQINGVVTGPVKVATQTLTVSDGAHLSGGLDYTSKSVATISQLATVSGGIVHREPPPTQNTKPVAVTAKPFSPAGSLAGIIFSILVGFLIIKLWPKSTARILNFMTDTPFMTWFVGFIAIMLIPLIGIFLVLTIIGIPFAVILFIVFALLLWVSRIYVGMWLGEHLLDALNVGNSDNKYLQVLVGFIVLWLMFRVPLFGGLVSFLAVVWGLGAIVQVKRLKAKK